MPKVYNRVKVATATTGTGTMTLGAAQSGYQTWAAAGAADGDLVQYLVEDGTAWEFGTGTYSSAGPTLARTAILESSNSDAAINLSGAGIVSCVPFAESLRGRHTIWVPAVSMVPRTTNGPSVGLFESTTNKVMVPTLDFDATTSEYAQFTVWLPPSWNGGALTYHPVWSHAAGTGSLSWKLSGRAIENQDAFDQAFGTEVEVADIDGSSTNAIFVGPESAAVTLAGDTGLGNRLGIFQIRRDPADSQDTLAIDARLHGIVLFYTTNTPMDDVTPITGDPP